jgi:hypothetical protein
MGTYCGPSGAAKPADLEALERRGWVAEEKADGCYVELWVGQGGVVKLARYRGGGMVGRDSGRDVLGLRTPWPAGTVIAGELQVQTPAAHRWQDAHGGVRGVVVFDILAWGNIDEQLRQLARGELGRGPLPARDMSSAPQAERRAVLERLFEDVEAAGGRAARVLHLVRARRRGLRGWFEQLVGEGGEGIVVKDPGAPAGRGARKVKRRDDVTCTVLAVELEARRVMLAYGSAGMPFGASLPAFPMAVGDLVDVAVRGGFYDDGRPRHLSITRRRDDLVIPA